MKQNLRNKTLSGFFWRLAEKIGLQGVTFVVQIVLARLLLPEQYGTVALIVVFTDILQVFIDSGMGNALIQKKDADDLDFSTVFYFNIFICTVLYLGMFVVAPYIDLNVYDGKYEGLTSYIRVLSITLIISGLKNVQVSYVSKHMQFKKFFFSTIGATIFSAVVGIAMAYNGYGVWAIIGQRLTNTFMSTLILWFTVKWKPKLMFSFSRLKGLFSYGWKLLCSSLIDRVYYECRQFLIGGIYSATDLGLYNQGDKIPKMIATNINASIDGVLFPALSQEQDHKDRIKSMTRRSIKTSGFVIWPIMLGLAAVAEPLIDLLLGEKWMGCVFFLRIFCITYAFYPIHTANLNAIKAMGRSDIFLVLEIVKKSVGIILLISTMFISVKALACSLLLSTLASSFINAFPNRKLLGYSYFEQIKDIIPSMTIAGIMAVAVYFVHFIPLNNIILLFIQVIVGVVIYVGLSWIFKLEAFTYIVDILIKFFARFKKAK